MWWSMDVRRLALHPSPSRPRPRSMYFHCSARFSFLAFSSWCVFSSSSSCPYVFIQTQAALEGSRIYFIHLLTVASAWCALTSRVSLRQMDYLGSKVFLCNYAMDEHTRELNVDRVCHSSRLVVQSDPEVRKFSCLPPASVHSRRQYAVPPEIFRPACIPAEYDKAARRALLCRS
jgi:hypothetical protein